MPEAQIVQHINSALQFVADLNDRISKRGAIWQLQSALYISTFVYWVMERPLKTLWTDEEMNKLENVISKLQALVIF